MKINRMASLVNDMFHRALGAFITEDVSTARTIPLEDDMVDELFNQIQHIIIHVMVERPEISDHANLLLWVAHNLERMADRVSNICERTIFVATGELMEIESKKERIELIGKSVMCFTTLLLVIMMQGSINIID